MDKKCRTWLLVLALLLLIALMLCVSFKLQLDDARAKYAGVLNNPVVESVTAAPSAAAETPGATDEPAADPTEPTVAGYTAAEVEAMEAELETSRAHERELEDENAALQAELDSYKSAEPTAEAASDNGIAAELETAMAENDRLTAELETANTENDRLTAENNSLKAELADATAENDRLAAELEAANAEDDGLAGELADANAENDRLAAELETANTENDRLAAELEAANAEDDELAGELADANAENDRLAAELEAANAENDRLEDELETANIENDRLTSELETAYADIARMDGELAAYRGGASAALVTDDAVTVAADGVSAAYAFTNNAPGSVVYELSIGDKVLYTSDELAPGQALEGFTLNEALAPGSYEAMLTTVSYRQDGSVLSRIMIPVSIVVAE